MDDCRQSLHGELRGTFLRSMSETTIVSEEAYRVAFISRYTASHIAEGFSGHGVIWVYADQTRPRTIRQILSVPGRRTVTSVR